MTARLLPALLALALAGCAAAQPGYDPMLGKVAERPKVDIGEVGAGGQYHMSETEKAFDCKKLTGAMQITISRLKDKAERPNPSNTSTTMKGMIAPLFGGSSYNTNPEGEIAREKAKLHAYNRALADKGCKTMDVEAELARPPEGPVRY